VIESNLTALILTLKLACLSTLILLCICCPLAWWLSRTKSHLKTVIQALGSLPLVLPPTVLGFYLLIALGPMGPFAGLLQFFGLKSLAFSFVGLVIGSIIYSFPFALQPLHDAFSQISDSELETAGTLGASPRDRFFSIALPLAKPGFLTAAILSFAHTLGEFGVVLMIGGNIPGETKVLSIDIYDHVESLNFAMAHQLSILLLVFSFMLLLLVYLINGRFRVIKP